MQPGQLTGIDKLVNHLPLMRELSTTELMHDAVGIMELQNQYVIGEPWGHDTWSLHRALYARLHFSPRVAAPEIDPAYLDGMKIIFTGGDIINTRQVTFLQSYLQAGGHLVLTQDAGKYRQEDPDNDRVSLTAALGIDRTAHGGQLPGLAEAHDLFTVGKGQVLLLRSSDFSLEGWTNILPTLLTWGGVRERLADSADPDMQIHVLRNEHAYYLATTHRNELGGPDHWTGQVRWCAPLPTGRYQLTEMMSGMALGVMTPAQLDAGFDAGAYTNLQMKIFQIERIP
jgi:hypothetical protein